MTVLRIVPNLATDDPIRLARFYRAVFGLDPLMEMDFIHTLGGETAPSQLSLASEGGGGTPLPAVSIEVDDMDACLTRARAEGADVPYGPVQEPWGVQRFFLRDPDGHLINVLSHAKEPT